MKGHLYMSSTVETCCVRLHQVISRVVGLLQELSNQQAFHRKHAPPCLPGPRPDTTGSLAVPPTGFRP